jgi:hypothetical protein
MKITETVIKRLRAMCAQHYVEFNKKGLLHGLRSTLGIDYHGAKRLSDLVEGTDIAIRQAGAKGPFICTLKLETLLALMQQSEPFALKVQQLSSPSENESKELSNVIR